MRLEDFTEVHRAEVVECALYATRPAPLLSRAELLARYRHLREVSRSIIPPR